MGWREGVPPKLVRYVAQGAITLALAGVVILTTQWAYPAGHLVIRMDPPYYSHAVGEDALYVQLDITMKNVGADAVRVDGEHFILIDNQGTRYPRDPSTHFISNHYDYLTMPPGYQFTATSIYKIPPERWAAWLLFVAGDGRNVRFRLPPPPSVSSQSGGVSPAEPSAAPAPVSGSAARTTGRLTDVLAEMAARSRGIGPKDLATADQLVDLLPHLSAMCSAGARAHGSALVAAATECARDAEGATTTIAFLRDTLASPAGRGMPEVIRHDWDGVLLRSASAVHDALLPLWTRIGQERSGGDTSAATFRALGDLRTRIGRVLAKTSPASP